MQSFQFADLTDLESAPTKESLKALIGRVLERSESVRVRIEELTFGTGEYAVVLRGVLRRPEEAEDVSVDKGGAATG